MNEMNLMMRSPRPANGQVSRNYERQGPFGQGRLGPLIGGQTYVNSYSVRMTLPRQRHPNPVTIFQCLNG